MSNVAIRVETLGKRYRVGRYERYQSLREHLAGGWRVPIRAARRIVRPSRSAESDNWIWALKDISLEVKRGEIVGIIGRNGAGKSTLLKILSRVTDPTEGLADLHGRVASLLEVGTGFHPELTGRENIYLNGSILGMRRAEIERKFDEIVAFAEVERFLDTQVKHYSSGMYMRLAFAVAAHLEPEILVIDEVLAVGDAAFQRKSLGKMSAVAKEGRTVLFVSHNMGAVANLCTRGIGLDHGGIFFDGSTLAAIDAYHHAVFAANEIGSAEGTHVLYQESAGTEATGGPIRVTKVELIDAEGRPKPLVSTWDQVCVRIHYRADHRVQVGSVTLEIRALDGPRLLLLSTRPDGTLELAIEPGDHTVDCLIQKLPLSAGDYILGAGLAVPNAEWLWLKADLAGFTVLPRDVYGSGLAPTSARAHLATEHRWTVVS